MVAKSTVGYLGSCVLSNHDSTVFTSKLAFHSNIRMEIELSDIFNQFKQTNYFMAASLM